MDPKRYKKIVLVSFVLSLTGVAIFLSKYLTANEEAQLVLGGSGLGLMVASIILRWTAKLRPGWFERKGPNT
ncbi:MAG TPA: hypothetical protein PKE63_04770 [Lacibacter sp.]|nr:hypothetical protein [Lacibacter sp.]HMO88895.1 hypothetical protein [Lacibacter sp.]HMP86566.1 hypothetical protein [Lacibacter sp.]